MKAIEYVKNLPDRVSSEAIEGEHEVFHFDLKGEGGGQATVRVEDGTTSVEKGLNGTPTCTIEADADVFKKLVEGDLNPMMALMTGKLNISNQGVMMKYAKKFGLM